MTCRPQFGALPPFTIEIEAAGTTVPGLHSFAMAQSGSRWLIIGGRTNGLHGFSSNDAFPTQYANNEVVVIDTTNWQYWTSSLSALPYSMADPLRSTNMQFFQDSAYLYMVGGYGFDSILYDNRTFPTITALHVDNLINAVIAGTPIAPHIRQVVNNNLRVCGGELFRLGTDYYLVFGHDFQGTYTNPPTPYFTQVYTNQVRRFTLYDNGTTLTVSNFTYYTDTAQYHRRDLNVFPVVNPDESFSIGCYGGVFRTDAQLPFLNPVYISDTGISIHPYQQVMSHYTSAGIPLFDTATKKMYTVFLGGISLYDYDPLTNTVAVDSLVPFISDVTTLTKHANGNIEERVMPVQLPGLLGSNAEFVPAGNISLYPNGTIRFRDFPNQRTLIGYLYGGIRANAPNIPLTWANDTVYRIYLTPDFSVSSPRANLDIELLTLYPNPAQENITLQFKINKEREVSTEIYNAQGQSVACTPAKNYPAGHHMMPVGLAGLSPGIYFLKLSTGHDYRVISFIKR
ncbi:MAG: T9SS type A sorting domain-containing protein [Bacteroidota bacterium]